MSDLQQAVERVDALMNWAQESPQFMTEDIGALETVLNVARKLDVELHPALALTTMGKLIAEIADNLGDDTTLHDTLHFALDYIDEVIAALNDGEPVE